MADAQAVLSALNALNHPADKAAFEHANTWLQDFQHSNEAWATCNVLLLSEDSPPHARIFAAQTFRTKVTYDLSQLDASFLPSLKETITTALERCVGGPKIIILHLCLSLAGLALQFPSWQPTAVAEVIEKFGRVPASVPTLLQFLTVLPEEINNNTKIPVTNDDYKSGAVKLLTENANQVLSLLAMYMTASGVTPVVQSQIFDCLRSWVVAGEMDIGDVTKTPLLEFTFSALDSPQLFDAAVDLLCDIIHETQELDDCMDAIQIIVPKLIAVKPKIAAATAQDDSEQMRGFARIFSEAGEVYRRLLLQHPETFFPIVEAIGECSEFHDLDVVPITFPFWMRFAQSIGKKHAVSPLFSDAYKSLMRVLIQDLRFPDDPSTMTPQELDDFREFRHVMGDTLKDCCFVLGADYCLTTVYEYITTTMASAAGGVAVAWQGIEAPLFSLRSIGAEVDPRDESFVPQIMDLLPSLPDHPKVRYAAILVMSRYSEWTNYHPNYIPFQLQFISSGFDSTDIDVPAAASQAMKFLCSDCKNHMSPYLPQLHSFLTTIGGKLQQKDRMRIYEAVAYVISAMPLAQAAQSLHTFSVDILSKIHALVAKETPLSKPEVAEVCDCLENLEAMLAVVQTFGEDLPPSCANSAQEAWSVLDLVLNKLASDPNVSEGVTRVLRGGLRFFGTTAISVVPALLMRMTLAYESSGISSFLWITGKIVNLCGDRASGSIRDGIKQAYESGTSKTVTLLQQRNIQDMPDVIEDYLQLLVQLQEKVPDIFFESPLFPTAVRVAVAALNLIHSDVIFATLDVLRPIVTHDCLDPPTTTRPPPKFVTYAAIIRTVIMDEGPVLLANLLNGMVNDFPQEATSTVITIVRMIAIHFPKELLVWLPQALDQVAMAATFAPAKHQLIADVTKAINNGQLDQVKHAVIAFHRFSMKSRDRRRAVPFEQ